MPTTKLTIVPVALDSIQDNLPLIVPPQKNSVPNCMINAAGVEISFYNGVDEHHPSHHEGVEQSMKHVLMKKSVLHIDETYAQIIKRSDEKSGQANAYNWVFRSGQVKVRLSFFFKVLYQEVMRY